MISIEEAQAKFKELLANDPSWASIADSQFAKHVAVFCAWALRDAQWKAERDRQEFFLSTALNRASIQAHAEDREYVPTKAVPASGYISVTNSGTTNVSIPKGTELVTSTGVTVTTTEAATVPFGGGVSIIPAEQKEAKTYTYSVSEAVEFFECLLPLDTTPLVSEFSVSVTDSYGATTDWTYYRLLQNTYSDTRAYDEFYSHTGQIGIRFGNGNFGAIPQAGSTVTISTWETSGNIYIASGQKLSPVTALTSSAVLAIAVSTAFTGGQDVEDTESIRTNLHYWQTYNNEMIWAEDYKYFLRRKFPQILFVKAWGEQEMEAQAGAPSYDFVNKIYISAYAKDGEEIQTDCMDALEAVRPINREFEWIAVNHVTWTVALTGIVLDDISLTDAEADIRAALEDAYGKDSENRREHVYTSEIYEIIMGTGYFEANSGARFSLVTAGTTTPSQLQDMVSIDLDNSTFSLSYAS